MSDTKCIVFGCSNHKEDGPFVGSLCAPCHGYITTGKIGYTDSFLGALARENERMREAIHFALDYPNGKGGEWDDSMDGMFESLRKAVSGDKP